MPFAILPALQWLGSGFWSFASSRMGQIIIAFAVAWFWSAHKTNQAWEQRAAAEKAQIEAVYRAETLRQATASREIIDAATSRAAASTALAQDLQSKIDAFNSQESQNVPPPRSFRDVITGKTPAPILGRPCVIDDNFSSWVRRIDATNKPRATKSSKRARKLR